LKILFASSEVYPFAKTGGLGDVAGSLPKALHGLGHEVNVIMPRHGSILNPRMDLGSFTVPMGGGQSEVAELKEDSLDRERRVPVIMVDNARYFAKRENLYMYDDDGRRFAFFCRAILETVRFLRLRPDVIHCNDWHTGLVPAYLRTLHRDDPELRRARTLFTIHNLQYQGTFDREVFDYTGLPEDTFHMEGVEFYGGVNFLKAGIVYADHVSTVSQTYAEEIQVPEFGEGLDGVLRRHAGKLSGVPNGIDYEEWDPTRDRRISHPYGPDDLKGKWQNKKEFLKESGLRATDRMPLIGFISRLVDQKGLDILVPCLPSLLEEAQVVVLGTGDPRYHRELEAIASTTKGFALYLKYDEGLAHRIYASSDMFLMPSRFEPCGLGQLISMRYGTVPIARNTGGLADTVTDLDGDPGRGTGFVFHEYTAEALLEAARRAVRAYGDDDRWSRVVHNGFRQDFSWGASAEKYSQLYHRLNG
jgi:starch synthase